MDRTSRRGRGGRRAALAGLDVELRRVRVRHAGGRHFVDLVIGVPADTGVGQAHSAADDVEEAVRDALGDADVIVHVEPRAAEGGLRERATAAALTVPDVREVHNVRVIHTDDGYELSLHAKLPGELDLEHAHAVISQLEAAIQAAVPELRRVHTHIEPLAAHRLGRAAGRRRGGRAARGDRRRWCGATPARRPSASRSATPSAGRIALVTIALPGRAAARRGAPARRRHRGGRARALPAARGHHRPHRAGHGRRRALSGGDAQPPSVRHPSTMEWFQVPPEPAGARRAGRG